MVINKAVIAAGGSGMRFHSLADTLPKEMLPVNNKPLISLAVDELVSCGIREIILVISPRKTIIREQLSAQYEGSINFQWVIQEKPLGLGQAVGLTADIIGDDAFVLILPDDIFDTATENLECMIKIHEEFGEAVVSVGRIPEAEVSRYGIIDPEMVRERVHRVKSLVEKPPIEEAPSNLAVFGRYILTGDIFPILQTTLPGKNDEIQLTDALNTLAGQRAIYGYEFTGQRYDCGTLEAWFKTNVDLGVSRAYLEKYIDNLRNQ